jgi:hypothetical protein
MTQKQEKKIEKILQDGYRTKVNGDVITLSEEMKAQFRFKIRPSRAVRSLYTSKEPITVVEKGVLRFSHYKHYPPAIKTISKNTGNVIYVSKGSENNL